MPRVPHMTAVLVLLTASTSLAQAPAALRTEVQNVVRAYTDAANKADTSAYTEIYSRQAGVTSIADGTILRGWEAIRTDADSMLGREGGYQISVGSIDVTPLGTGFVLAVAPTTVNVQTDKGAVLLHRALTLVLQRTAEGWKIIHDHTSFVPLQSAGE